LKANTKLDDWEAQFDVEIGLRGFGGKSGVKKRSGGRRGERWNGSVYEGEVVIAIRFCQQLFVPPSNNQNNKIDPERHK
jgi:hypothetical protein